MEPVYRSLNLNVGDLTMVGYSNLAATVIMLYDYVLTFGSEVQLVWWSPWGIGKVLYFCTTYSAWADVVAITYLSTAHLSTTGCLQAYKAFAWCDTYGVVISEVALLFRTWALWGKNKRIALFLLLCLAAIAIAVGIFTHLGLRHIKFGTDPRPGVKTCWPLQYVGTIDFLSYLLLVLWESMILGLTLFKWRRHARPMAKLLVILYRDGILFYMYLLGCSLINMVVLVINPTPGPSLVLIQRFLHTILTKRLLLNLRRASVSSSADMRERKSDEETPRLPQKFSDASQSLQIGMLSTIVAGADTWFTAPQTSLSNTFEE